MWRNYCLSIKCRATFENPIFKWKIVFNFGFLNNYSKVRIQVDGDGSHHVSPSPREDGDHKTKSTIYRSKWCCCLLATLLPRAKSLNTLLKKCVYRPKCRGSLNMQTHSTGERLEIQSGAGASVSLIWAECDAAVGETGSGTEDWDPGFGFSFSFLFFHAVYHFTPDGFKEPADQWIFQTSWVRGSVCRVKTQKKKQHEESGGVLHAGTLGWCLSKQGQGIYNFFEYMFIYI